jgi:hypothetical protein
MWPRGIVSASPRSAYGGCSTAAVAGAILGRRLGSTDHRAEHVDVFSLTLDADDHSRIDAVLAKSRDLLAAIGDCGDEYR